MFWRKIIGYWRSILVAGIILYLSLIREPHFSLPHVALVDKWAHMLAYAVLGGVWIWELLTQQSRKWLLWGLMIPILYGGVIEILQEQFFKPRTGDWLDWCADIIGTCIGVGIGIIVAKMPWITKK